MCLFVCFFGYGFGCGFSLGCCFGFILGIAFLVSEWRARCGSVYHGTVRYTKSRVVWSFTLGGFLSFTLVSWIRTGGLRWLTIISQSSFFFFFFFLVFRGWLFARNSDNSDGVSELEDEMISTTQHNTHTHTHTHTILRYHNTHPKDTQQHVF
jgi:hypothetical protein